MTPYQIITPLISFFAVSYAWHLAFKQKKTLWEAALWTLFWVGIALIAIYPKSITYLTQFTGIKDRENAVFITAIGILFFLVFYLVMRLEELEQRQTRMVRKIGLNASGLIRKEKKTPKKKKA